MREESRRWTGSFVKEIWRIGWILLPRFTVSLSSLGVLVELIRYIHELCDIPRDILNNFNTNLCKDEQYCYLVNVKSINTGRVINS